MATMILVLGLTLWAFEARILRGQALSLRNRDFVLAAKVAGESTWRIVFGELVPNMISRIAAALRARLLRRAPDRGRARVPRPRRHRRDELGRHAVLGAGELDRAAGRVVAVLLPGRRARADGRRARLHPRRHRRGEQSAPPRRAAQARAPLVAPVRRAGGRDAKCSSDRVRRATRPAASEVLRRAAGSRRRLRTGSACGPSTTSRSRSARARSSGWPASRDAARARPATRSCRSSGRRPGDVGGGSSSAART